MKIILLSAIRLFMLFYNLRVLIDKMNKYDYELEVYEVKLLIIYL